MKYLYTFLIIISISTIGYGHFKPYQWSSVSKKDLRDVEGLSIQFFDAFNKKEFQKIRLMLPATEISYSGRFWMSIPRFTYLLSSAREKGPVNYTKLNVYSFDDCVKDRKARNAGLKHLRIFDNNSIIVSAVLNRKARENNPSVSLVFQKSRKDKKWKLLSLHGLKPALDSKEHTNLTKNQKGWHSEEIPQLNLTILIPPYFKGRKNHGNFISWVHIQKKQQEAVLQVMAAKSHHSPLEEGRQWLKRFLKNRIYTTVRVKLAPQGYRFELEMIDRDAKKNKVIIAALKKRKYTVFVAYIGYLTSYEKMYREIDFTMRNLLIE